VHKLPNRKYEVIDGHARLEAYRRMGITEIPAVENSVLEVIKRIGKGAVKVAGAVSSGVVKGAEAVGRAGETVEELREAYRTGKEESEVRRSARKLSAIHRLAKSSNPYVRRMAIAKLRRESPEELRELQEDKS
jgi:hypothetical protein